ncbi:MAG: hypothetical protein EB127_00815 [Alphaproteobacteria bacterium]|nr:hypothetical protein [Alphaproteobacteria bacterium]
MLPNFLLEKIKILKPFYESNVVHNIFSWQELENILNFRPVINNKRFFSINDSKKSAWYWQDTIWLSDPNTWPASLIQEIIKEMPVYMTDMSRANIKINNICHELENLLNYPTDAHIYFSLVEEEIETKGFPIHFDYNHNLIVQIEGTSRHKVWHDFGDTIKDETTRYISNMEYPPMLDTVMRPGDVIFIPKFFYHKVISKTKRLSISFPMADNKFDFETMQDRNWVKFHTNENK